MYLCVLDTHTEPGKQGAHGDSPGKNTGVGCHALLQGIFPTLGSNPGLLHCRQSLYHLSHQGSPCDQYVKGLLSSVGPQRPCVSVGFPGCCSLAGCRITPLCMQEVNALATAAASWHQVPARVIVWPKQEATRGEVWPRLSEPLKNGP